MFSTKFRIKPLGTSSRFVYVEEWSSEREVPLKSGVTEEWEGDLVTKCYSGRAISRYTRGYVILQLASHCSLECKEK